MTIADPVQVAMIFVKQKKAWASLVPRSSSCQHHYCNDITKKVTMFNLPQSLTALSDHYNDHKRQ